MKENETVLESCEIPNTIPRYQLHVSIVTKDSSAIFTTDSSVKIKMPIATLLKFFKRKNIVEFTIHKDKDNLIPENGAAMIMTELLKQKNLISLKFPKGFFTDKQISILQSMLDQNKHMLESKKLRIENRERQSNHLWTIIGTALGISAAFLAGQVLWLVLCCGAIGGFISGELRKLYSVETNKHYQDKKSIKTSSPDEKIALKFGVEAATWRGYFTSFIHWQTYRHPQAFATALQHTNKENEKLIKTIRAL